MSNLLFKDKPLVGLDISQTGIKIMAIDTQHWVVSGYGSIDLDPAKVQKSLDDDDDAYIQNNLSGMLAKNILGRIPSNHVVLSVPTARTFTRTFAIPRESEKNIADSVQLEIDQYIPIPAESLYVDYEITERTDENIVISLSAAPRTLIDKYTSIAEDAGLKVCAIEPSVSAVARLLERTEEGHLPTIIVDIGAAATDIAVFEGGSIKVTGSIAIGGNTFTLDIAKKLKVPLENAHQLKVLSGLNPGPRQAKISAAITPSLDKIMDETRKVIRYYTERLNNDKKIEQVLVVGGGSNIPGIGEFCTNSLVMPARVASPWQKLNFAKLAEPAKQFRARYITVAGLSILTPSEVKK